jgi:hypothetical protein
MADHKVDTDTQAEVDTIILDYLLCTVIITFLYTQEREKQWHCRDQTTNWLIHTINSMLEYKHHCKHQRLC